MHQNGISICDHINDESFDVTSGILSVNPYVVEAVDKLRRTLFFYVLIGVCGLLFAIIHGDMMKSATWLLLLTTITIYRTKGLNQLERSIHSENEAGAVLSRLVYFSGLTSSIYCLMFVKSYDEMLASVVSMGVMLLIVSGPLVASSFIFRERKIGLAIYMLANVLVLSFAWMRSSHDVSQIHIIGIAFVCAICYFKILANFSAVNGLDVLSLEGAISLQKVEKTIETTQLQVAQMSHNIRQTVQALNFQLEDVGGDKESLRRQLGLMDKFLVRLQNMGKLNRQGGNLGQKYATDVGDLVSDSLEIFRVLALNKGIHLSKSGSLTYVKLPPEEMYFILCNLISNTIRHSKATKASVTWVELGEYVEIAYQDNGIGFQFSPDKGVAIDDFRRFGVDSIEATLSARGIHYYWDWNSNPGMRFCFYVERMPRSNLQRGNFCLIIEDDAMAADWVSRSLRDKFDTVVSVASFEDAVIVAEESGMLPSVVISDLNLGGASLSKEASFDYVKKVRLIFNCSVVVVTGDVSASVETCGANHVLHKPIDRNELASILSSNEVRGARSKVF